MHETEFGSEWLREIKRNMVVTNLVTNKGQARGRRKKWKTLSR